MIGSKALWLTPEIPATQEAEIGRKKLTKFFLNQEGGGAPVIPAV
jgi:hypothetical protein